MRISISLSSRSDREGAGGEEEQAKREWVNDPIKCGFLKCFAEMEFSSENINYLIAVDAFRDNLLNDKVAWSTDLSWKTLDENLLSVPGPADRDLKMDDKYHDLPYAGDKSKWPSSMIYWNGVVEQLRAIWAEFISPDGNQQICIPFAVLKRTAKRLSFLHEYGPQVLEETVIDPWRTLRRDTLPRFFTSAIYNRWLERSSECIVLPSAESFTVRNPRGSKLTEWTIEDITAEKIKKLSISEVVHDIYLYTSFLAYLKSIYSSENLLCLRAMSVFHCFWVDTTKPLDRFGYPEGTEEGAWKVYRYFIAVGSVFEVSVSYSLRKSIMLSLACPTISMFNALERLTENNLKYQLKDFYNSKFFDTAIEKVKEDIALSKNSGLCMFWRS